MNFEKAEKFRSPHPLGIPHKEGDDYGWFMIPSKKSKKHKLRVMVAPSDSEWQHISISLPNRCPFWSEMCEIKDLFFNEDDVVVQYHPAKKDYVNIADNCLHLWKWNSGEFPTPPKICV